MNKIKSYIPEKEFFDGKNMIASRLFHDDCAMLDINNDFRVIAERGFHMSTGTPFFDTVHLQKAEITRIRQFIHSDEELLILPSEASTLLLFSALIQSTSTLLVIRTPHSEEKVRNALEFARRDAFSPVFCLENEQRSSEAELREQLAEIFYYLDRILKPSSEIGLWTHLLLIANFVGCRLDRISLPISIPKISQHDRDRLTAFFLSAFMILRYHTGLNEAISSTADESHAFSSEPETSPHFSIQLRHLPLQGIGGKLPKDEQELLNKTTTPFNCLLSLPEFEKVRHTQQNNSLMFEIPIHKSTSLAAFQTTPHIYGYTFCIEIQQIVC